jgi:hypothetical protein
MNVAVTLGILHFEASKMKKTLIFPNWIHIYRAYLRFSHMIATSYTMNFHVNDPFQMIGLRNFQLTIVNGWIYKSWYNITIIEWINYDMTVYRP